MATPPPAVLNVSSPKFAPLSPVHTNSLGDAKSLNVKAEPTNFSLPPSYGEDRVVHPMSLRGSFDVSMADKRLPTGGKFCIFDSENSAYLIYFSLDKV